MSTLSERIHQVSKELGYSQGKMATLAKIKPSSMNLWFSGETKNPSSNAVAMLAKACGVSAEWLATGRGEMRYGDQDKYTALPPVTIPDLLEAIKEELDALPADKREMVSGWISDYTKTPDRETGEQIAKLIERVVKKG